MTRAATSGNRLILVEGESDRQVVLSLLRRKCEGFNISGVNLMSRGGKSGVISDANNQLRGSPFTSGSRGALGIVVDADDDVSAI